MDSEILLVQLARLVVEDRRDDALLLIRRDLPRLSNERPDLSDKVASVMSRAAAQPTRAVAHGIRPLDQDTKLNLVREEIAPTVDVQPIWHSELQRALSEFVEERAHVESLARAGITPTSTLLFTGPPGVGKTLAARWVAQQTKRPLLTLDLAAVMSSFLGRTGNNIRAVLDYAQSIPCVLLLDEFDAIAKRRDDAADVGELKRLVTVLLQAVDEWPTSGILIAATNHPELLDPAAWRRFELVLRFVPPGVSEVVQLLRQLLAGSDIDDQVIAQCSSVFAGQAPSEIVREVNASKRDAALGRMPLIDALLLRVADTVRSLSKDRKMDVARNLAAFGLSQRDVCEFTGLSRDTLRARGIGTQKSSRRRM